jgi:hypothetical protein
MGTTKGLHMQSFGRTHVPGKSIDKMIGPNCIRAEDGIRELLSPATTRIWLHIILNMLMVTVSCGCFAPSAILHF